MEKYDTFLPCFPGFYNSLLYSEEWIYEFARSYCAYEDWGFPQALLDCFFSHQRLGSEFEPQFDFEGYSNECARLYCQKVGDELSGIIGPVNIKFQSIVSPKEYNFHTDSVNCEIEFDVEKVLAYCRSHYAKFAEYLNDNYKSRDGFISFYSCNPEEWLKEENWNHHKPGSLLQFILLNELGPDTESNLSLRVLEDIYYYDYIKMPEKLEAFLESPEARTIADEYYRLMKQGDLYLEAMGPTYRGDVEKGKKHAVLLLVDDMENALAK